MIQRFCDACGTKVNESAEPLEVERLFRPSGRVVTVSLTVSAAVNGNWDASAFDLCRHCIIDTVAAADDRPIEAAS